MFSTQSQERAEDATAIQEVTQEDFLARDNEWLTNAGLPTYETVEDWEAALAEAKVQYLGYTDAVVEAYGEIITDEELLALREAEVGTQSCTSFAELELHKEKLSATAAQIDTRAIEEAKNKKVNFLNEWTPRLNNYLAGSALAGYGEVFAAAAYDYGIDPRYSAAISCIESGKGANCFRAHNAWGWGGSSWSSWEEAIYAHAKGLAASYGYTVSESAAQRYCPPNWSGWYSNVKSEMSKI